MVLTIMSPPGQTAALLDAVPSALEECLHSVPDPQQLRTVLQYHSTPGQPDLDGTWGLTSQRVDVNKRLHSRCVVIGPKGPLTVRVFTILNLANSVVPVVLSWW